MILIDSDIIYFINFSIYFINIYNNKYNNTTNVGSKHRFQF